MKDVYKEAIAHPVFKIISEVADQLSLEAYVVGGFVRDFFLHRTRPTDIDIVAVGGAIGLAEAVAERLRGKPKVAVFKNFGTAMIKHEDLQLEFVGARRESYRKDSRKPFVEEGSLRDDQLRRDFTINALAFRLNEDGFGALYDPFDGLKDLAEKRIRTPLDPETTYGDDPLRMLRAARFAAQLGFFIDPPSLEAIQKTKHRIRIISEERIVGELYKIMMSAKPSVGFLLLDQTGLLEIILPELTHLKGVDDVDGQRHKDNFYHTLEVVDNICKTTDDLWLRWAALLHDIGKFPTKRYDPKIGWTFHNHEFVGSKMVYKIFKRLKMPLGDQLKFVQKMVSMSSRPIILAEDVVTDSALRRLLFDAGDHIDDLLTLCAADITTKNEAKRRRYQNNFKIVRKKIIEVEERDRIRNFQPPVDGELIMKTFDLQPCKSIGLIKDAIKDAILEGVIPNEYAAAYRYMLDKGKEIGLNPVNGL